MIILLPAGFLFSEILASFPLFIEKAYSRGIYKSTGQVLSITTGILPFSLAEVILILLLLLMFYKFIKTLVKIIIPGQCKQPAIMHLLTFLLIFANLGYYGFMVTWGFNYHRLPFAEIAKLDTAPASFEELETLCERLIRQANTLRNSINENNQGLMVIEQDNRQIFDRAIIGYEKATPVYQELGGIYGRPKQVLFPKAMSLMGISGMYFPFTGEANVNTDIPDSMLPCTICHEMAHQRGFAREDEANYIAYFTCSIHPDVDFQYSGTLLASIYAMNALHRYDQEKYAHIRTLFSQDVLRDLSHLKSYWQQYHGPIAQAISKLNNSYLKANQQKDGVYSYGRMVDLLLAEQRQQAP